MLEQGRKVVVFSQWRRMLTLAHWATSDLLKADGLRAGFFTGAEGQRRRTQNIVEFHDDPSFRMLFTSDAGGVGLNLQRAANCVVNLELPWNPAVLEQRIGRIYRLGQKQPIDVYNLVCEYGIESRIAGIVGSKQAFFKGLFDGDSDTVEFGQASNFLARIQKLYEPAALESVATTGDVADEDADVSDTELDDSVADPLDELIETGDESHDQVLVPSVNGDSGPPAIAARAGSHQRRGGGNGRARRRSRRCLPRAKSANSSRSSRSAGRQPAGSSSRRPPRPRQPWRTVRGDGRLASECHARRQLNGDPRSGEGEPPGIANGQPERRTCCRRGFVLGRIGNPSYTFACSIRGQSLQMPARQGMLV